MTDMAGRVTIVTGGAMGIGREVALRLARDGGDVALADLDNDLAVKVAEEIRGLGRKAEVYQVDISDWSQVKEMAEAVEGDFGRIDNLVNSAGILGPTVPVAEFAVEDWKKVLAVNLDGIFYCCKAVLPFMKARGGGRIVNISSMAAKDGNPGMAAYVASKGAVISFTKGLSKEVAADGILVHAIAPTVIESPLIADMDETLSKNLLAKIPLGRFGQPSEVAAMIKFLLSDECTFTTGFCHDLSGGRAVY